MPLDGVCLWSPAVPSSCLGTETSVKDISPAQLGQRSKRSNTWGEITQSHAASASSFPLDTGHMLSLGLQAIFRLAFFFPLSWKLVSSISRYLATYYFYDLSQKAYKEKCFYESAHFHLTLHLNQTVWTLRWNKFCGQCHFGIFHFGEGLHILNTSIIAGFVHFFNMVFVIQRIFC